MLILVVCALFVANSATAAVRARRQELGVLAALGWTRPRLFGVVLGEVALIGLIAGLLATLLSLPLAAALGLHASPARAALAIPVAIAVALAAGAVPAWLAARADPVASVRPPVLAVRRARQPRRITGLAVVNVLRTPGRTLIGALSLAVGVMSLTLLVAVTLAFRGAVVGTLLGNLDSRTAAGILDLLAGLRRETPMTVIIATHDPQIAARCDRLIRLRDGALTDDIEIADGRPAEETIRRVGQLG